jgi:hypothetical protein
MSDRRTFAELVDVSDLPEDVEGIFGEALGYWLSTPRTGDIPKRSDFEPSDVPRLLPQIVLLEVLRDPLDFRYRVIGAHVREHFFEDYTGRLMSSVPHIEPDGPLRQSLALAMHERKPVRPTDLDYEGPKRLFKQSTEVILPLANEAGDVSHLIAIVQFVSRPYETS